MRPAITLNYSQLHELTKTKYYDELPVEIQHRLETIRPAYKSLWQDQLHNNKVLLVFCFASIGLSMFMVAGSIARNKALIAENNRLKDQVQIGLNMSVNYADYTDKLETDLASCSAKLPKQKTFKGKVSYYSHDGCLGCGANQTTSSGEPFDETKYTMAIPVEWKHIPMKTMATATNLDNGKSIQVRINDRGGFLKYDRVGDLSKAAYIALGAKTDKSIIEVSY